MRLKTADSKLDDDDDDDAAGSGIVRRVVVTRLGPAAEIVAADVPSSLIPARDTP